MDEIEGLSMMKAAAVNGTNWDGYSTVGGPSKKFWPSKVWEIVIYTRITLWVGSTTLSMDIIN